MTRFTFSAPEAQARRVHDLVKSSLAAHKNWLCSAVERGDLVAAQKLVAEVRALEALFAATNIDAKYEIAKLLGRPLETDITIEERNR